MYKLAEAFYTGRELVAQAIEAEEGEKVASEVRGSIEADKAVDEIKLATYFETLQLAHDFLVKKGHTKAADDLANAAQEEANAVEEEPDEEAIGKAIVDGAAAQIADATGTDPDDPDVQDAAHQIVSDVADQVSADADAAAAANANQGA